VLANTGPLCDVATIAVVISPVVMSAYRSGPRWLMALADGNAAGMLGYVTAITMAAAAAALALVTVRSRSDVRRYVAMRKM
jgi:Family of unknown function (DUF6893)